MTNLLQDQRQLLETSRERLSKLTFLDHHPIWSLALNRRVRIKSRDGDWLEVNENDGRTSVSLLIHLGQCKVY